MDGDAAHGGEDVLAASDKVGFFATIGIVAVTFVLMYAMLSKRSLSEIFSFDNLNHATAFNPSPFISIPILLFGLFILVRRSYKILSTDGKYLWISNGALFGYAGELAKLDNIEPNSFSLIKKFSTYLSFRKKDGSYVSFRMNYAKYRDDEELIEKLNDAVRSSLP